MDVRSKPRVMISRCLGFAACRHDGQQARAGFVARLTEYVDAHTLCPEVDIGMPIPRDPIRLVVDGDRHRLLQPSTGHDFTETMVAHAEREAVRWAEVDGFVFKTRSPSCALDDCKVYGSIEKGPVLGKAAGLYAGTVRKLCPRAMFIDEGHLTHAGWRHHYLSGIYHWADFRRVEREGTMAALVAFHTRHKLLLLGVHEAQMRGLGKIVANHERLSTPEVFEAYGDALAVAWSGPPSRKSQRNVLQHAFGYVSSELTAAERQHFLRLLEELGADRIHPPTLIVLLQSWIHRFDVEYLAQQSYFDPYPAELVDLSDSGR